MMNLTAQLDNLKAKVEAAEQEASMAVMFHETWKPAAYDEELHERMGTSYATNSFLIVRRALRRETLLALMRMWDGDTRAVSMQHIAKQLSDPALFDALVACRLGTRGPTIRLGGEHPVSPDTVTDAYRAALKEKRDQFCELVGKYTKGGGRHAAFRKLEILRHINLAHRQALPAKTEQVDATEEEIETFYQDSLQTVELLLSLVLGRAFSLAEDAADVHRHHAGHFWAAARGERTAGHPNYKPKPQ